VTLDVGIAAKSATVTYLQGPPSASLMTRAITLGGAAVSADGTWAPKPPYSLATSGNTVSLLVPPANAALVRVY
jgi:hypothetical protein